MYFLLMVGVFAACEAAYPRPTRPHIAIFCIDDLGWADVGYRNGSFLVTPNIDEMMKTGLVLDRYYTQPVCSPTRSALMQGRYPFHTGMQHFSTLHPATGGGMPADMPTMAELLEDAGYHSYMVGKWHLGYARWRQTPTGRGFRSHLGYLQGMEDYYGHNFSVPKNFIPFNTNAYDFWANRSASWDKKNQYSTDIFVHEVDRLLKDYADSGAAGDNHPLFLYMAHQVAHVPISAPPDPAHMQACSSLAQHPLRHTYCAMVHSVDAALGKFVASFKNHGLWDNTLLIVTTDNGGMPNYGAFPAGAGCNLPFRAGKATVFEGGVHAIGMINGGDSVMPGAVRGSASDALMHVVDWLPMVLAMADYVPQPPVVVDGHDNWDVLFNGHEALRSDIPIQINTDISVPNNGFQIAILQGDYKMIHQKITGKTLVYDGYFPCTGEAPEPAPVDPDGTYLFNLREDPGERTNLYSSSPNIVKQLSELLDGYMQHYVKAQPNVFDPLGLPNLHNNTWAPYLP